MKANQQPGRECQEGMESEPNEIDLAVICKALGHPMRVEIMYHLRRLQRCFCGDLVARLPLAQSTVSQHLKVLKQAGLIHSEVSGPCTHYCINQQKVDAFKARIATI